MAGLFVLITGRLVVLLHNNFWTFDYDLGIFDQAIWLMSRAEGFITIRGLEVFGHHASFAYYLLVPFYWLGLGPNFLNLLQVLAVAVAALILFRWARHLLGNGWTALLLSGVFLMHFTNVWLIRETFHPEVIAMAPFLGGYIAAKAQKWRSFALLMAFAVSWKEDIALAVLMVGVILVIRGFRRYGLYTIGASLVYFVLVTQVFLPRWPMGPSSTKTSMAISARGRPAWPALL